MSSSSVTRLPGVAARKSACSRAHELRCAPTCGSAQSLQAPAGKLGEAETPAESCYRARPANRVQAAQRSRRRSGGGPSAAPRRALVWLPGTKTAYGLGALAGAQQRRRADRQDGCPEHRQPMAYEHKQRNEQEPSSTCCSRCG